MSPVRLALGALLVLVIPIAANGCGGSSYLTIRGPDKAAVGDQTSIRVWLSQVCNGKVFGGPSDPTGNFCPGGHKVTKVLDAACDGGACVVESIGPPDSNGVVTVSVVGNTAGPTVFRARAAIDDGSELSATDPVSFVTATGLHVTCDEALAGDRVLLPPYGQCGGLYPVFTDSSFKWTIAFDSDAGLVSTSTLSVAVQGDAITFDSASGWFHSGSTAGTAQVTISSPLQFTKTVPVRVASAVEVVSGELRLVTPTDGIDQELVQVGPAPTTLWYPTRGGLQFDGDTGTTAFMASLTLLDGSQAYGGGGLFVSDHPEVCAPSPLPAGTNLLQQTEVQTECHAVGRATFAATVGAATITWPVTVAPPP